MKLPIMRRAKPLGLLLTLGMTTLCAQQGGGQDELIPVGPGYMTKGYKMIVNGHVVQTTDGQQYDLPSDLKSTPQATAVPAATPWPSVVTIINGEVVDPETRKPVTNLPAEVELIPLGLRKIATGDAESPETVVPFFRVLAKDIPAQAQVSQPKPAQKASLDQHPASIMGPPVEGPDFSELLIAQEDPQETESGTTATDEERAEEDSGGGFFDFLFGESEPDPGERVINLEGPLTEEDMAIIQNDPQFQDYLRKRINTSRNFYSNKGRAGPRNAVPKLPKSITVEEFIPEEWEVEGPTPPTPNIAVGKLVSVDPERQIAVCWLQTRYLRPNRPMVTRNYEMETTGVLLPSGEQDGRAAGFWIAEGNPSPGDEVIVPGPAYEKLVNRW